MDSTMVAVTQETTDYPIKHLPMALREVAANVFVECEPHVLEDMGRIANQAADWIEARIQSEGRTEAADEIASLRARVEVMREALQESGTRFDTIVSIAAGCSQTHGDPGGGLEMIHAEACQGYGIATSAQFTDAHAHLTKDSDNAE